MCTGFRSRLAPEHPGKVEKTVVEEPAEEKVVKEESPGKTVEQSENKKAIEKQRGLLKRKNKNKETTQNTCSEKVTLDAVIGNNDFTNTFQQIRQP